MIIKEHLGIPDFVASFIEQHYHNYRTTEVYIKEFYGLENMFSAEMYDELDEVIKEIIVYRIIKRECTVLNELVSIEQSLFKFRKFTLPVLICKYHIYDSSLQTC